MRPTKEELEEIEREFKEGAVKFDFKKLQEQGVSWFTRLLLKISPTRGILRVARELGYRTDMVEQGDALFGKAERVDLIPSESGQRGFILILNKNTTFYFYQDGDHFVYDGFETGEYEGGDVTVFDGRR